MKRAKKILLKVLRWAGWTIAALLLLFIIFIYSLRIPAVQNKITQRALSFLKSKIKTEVRLESILVSFPKKIVLTGLYLEDQSKDTLLYAEQIGVDTDLWALLNNKIELNTIELKNSKAAIKREASDSSFNFSYIIEAFTGDTANTTAPADTSAGWEFSIEDVTIQQTVFRYTDAYAGSNVFFDIGELVLVLDGLDLARSDFSVESLLLRDIDGHVELYQPGKPPSGSEKDTTAALLPNIDFNSIELNRVNIQYSDSQTRQKFQARIDEFTVEATDIDLVEKRIHLEEIELKNSEAIIRQEENEIEGSKPIVTEQSEKFSGINIPWDVKIDQVTLIRNTIEYNDDNFTPTTNAFDPHHFVVAGLTFSATNLKANKNTVNGTVNRLSFFEKNGFSVQSWKAWIRLTNDQLIVENFKIRAGESEINLDGEANFPSLADYRQATLDFRITKSSIALKDILFFSPHLLDSVPLQLPTETKITIESGLRGSFQDLTIDNLRVKTLNATMLSLSGNIKGLPETENIVAQFNLKGFRTTSAEIRSILPDSILPESIQLPEWIELTGKYNGPLKSPTIQVALTSDLGSAEASGKFELTELPSYDAVFKTQDLQLGKILKQPGTIGKLNMNGSIKGSGVSMDSLNTKLDILVSDFEYQQYTYEDFKLEGTLNNYLFSGTASLHDENLDFTVKGDLDYQQEIPLYKFTLALNNANFQKLKLSERPLKARGTLDINLSTSDFKIINGNMAIRKVAIYNGESLYMVDSLLFASIDQEGESSMSIQSDILSGEFKGTFNLFKIPGVIRQHINQYFSLRDETLKTFETPTQFKFDLTLRNTDLITEILIPELEPFIPGKISGEFDSEENKLNIEIDIAQIKYSTTRIDSLSAYVTSDEEALRYKFRLKNVKLDTLTIDAAQLTGKIENDSILSSFQILNAKEEEKYVLGGVFKSQEENFRFHFLENQVLLNYTVWKAPPDNYLEFSNEGFTAHNFSISSGQEKIALVTTVKDSTVSIEFDQLQLSSLTRIVRGVMPANGRLNGNLKFTTAAQGRFSSRLRIDDLEILEKPFGDLTLSMTHAGNRYALDLLVKDSVSNVTANGFYESDDKVSEFNITANFSPLDLQTVEALSFGQLKNVKGIATGNLKLTGDFKQPSIRGNITFQDASFKSTYLNSSFTLANETISFEESGIVLKDFTIRDNKKNEAVIRGNILTKAYRDFRFNMTLNARNFQLLNTTEKDNKLYYGKVRINTQARITGNAKRPRVDMNVSFSNDTEFTYVVPQEQKSVMEQKGIVQFVDKDAKHDPFLAGVISSDTIVSTFVGVNFSANLELNDQETLNIVIDPATGDKLSVQGNSNLTFDMDASGNMNLSGRYEISKGSYELSFYKLVKRKFDIEKGSTIVWAGNPLNATLDIRANYRVETSPIDLIANQITTSDQAQINTYRQRLPFLVYLDIEGQLLAPQISFKIDMPVDKRNAFGGAIYARITDINTRESDVNKQVFALLILKRFMSDNPLESQAGSDIANTTRTSASRILSDQLNRLSENIKGVQLSFDIKSYEDYSTGQAQGDTQVQLGVSKSLFNDRLVVKLSGNVDVEGESTQQENAADYIGDLALEYKLTSDGRFRITGFRTSNYDMIDGELIETGVGLLYIKDYNTLRELFKANAKEK